eukprot:1632725-Rhodomonas_salina.2
MADDGTERGHGGTSEPSRGAGGRHAVRAGGRVRGGSRRGMLLRTPRTAGPDTRYAATVCCYAHAMRCLVLTHAKLLQTRGAVCSTDTVYAATNTLCSVWS